jgi:hypothetical protein
MSTMIFNKWMRVHTARERKVLNPQQAQLLRIAPSLLINRRLVNLLKSLFLMTILSILKRALFKRVKVEIIGYLNKKKLLVVPEAPQVKKVAPQIRRSERNKKEIHLTIMEKNETLAKKRNLEGNNPPNNLFCLTN